MWRWLVLHRELVFLQSKWTSFLFDLQMQHILVWDNAGHTTRRGAYSPSSAACQPEDYCRDPTRGGGALPPRFFCKTQKKLDCVKK